ncbi:hypothetical protein ATZ36_16850 [Candidatus Endomicrobiellum trichonymphae]|uniref:Protein translocase subunit SecE n=1 Tax=Endomicrobium trichonymphae TaxID=1408204 RepID=A0A1E5IKI1_ENDTX|nr:hypothetical protein ATZ36_16850 [Candidatus Endomicrobium trichonymphae]
MNLVITSIQFFKKSYYEFKKVTWLGKKEVEATTVIVITFVVIMSVFVSVVDLFLGAVVSIIL